MEKLESVWKPELLMKDGIVNRKVFDGEEIKL